MQVQETDESIATHILVYDTKCSQDWERERSRLLANIKILAVLTSENERLQIRVLPSSSSLRKDWRCHHSGSGSGGLEGFVSDQRQPCKRSKKCTEENVCSIEQPPQFQGYRFFVASKSGGAIVPSDHGHVDRLRAWEVCYLVIMSRDLRC